MKPLIIILLSLILIILAVAGAAYPFARRAVDNFEQAQAAAFRAEQILREQKDFRQAANELKQAEQFLNSVSSNLGHLAFLQAAPWVSRDFKAARAGISAAAISSRVLASMLDAAYDAYEPLRASGQIRIGDLSKDKRLEILDKIIQATPKLQQSKNDLVLAEQLIDQAPRPKFLPQISESLSKLNNRVDIALSLLDDGLPLIEAFPGLLGFPESKTYLFVLQNNAEMRPTGGFIGTYGLITFDAGHITNFETDDVYNLDRFSPTKTRPLSPEPIKQYLNQPRWYLRDANWNPDFPTSAEQILRFYKEESAYISEDRRQKTEDRNPSSVLRLPSSDIAGVIAITPEAIRPLLEITGPITVSGQTFNADNLTDALEYEVEIGFAQKGIPRAQRKQIISELGHALIAKIMALPSGRWQDVLRLTRRAFDEKHILIYSAETGLQAILNAHNWDGSLVSAPQDYLAVFDANMFSMKTDPYVSRSIFYHAYKEGNGFFGETEIVYSYPKPGPFWKTKGYRTWTRVYVPQGSILSSFSGTMKAENSVEPGQVAISQEFGKTVFGAFLAVQAGQTKRLKFKYRLPDDVVSAIEQGSYELYAQKQPGTIGHDLTVAVDFGKVAKLWEPRGLRATQDGTGLVWRTRLKEDQKFRMEF